MKKGERERSRGCDAPTRELVAGAKSPVATPGRAAGSTRPLADSPQKAAPYPTKKSPFPPMPKRMRSISRAADQVRGGST